MPHRLAIFDGMRTPFARAGGALARLTAEDLGRRAVDALLTRTGLDPAALDEVIFGCAFPPADRPNLAEGLARRAGVPGSVPATTVQRGALSSCEALTAAQQRLAAGRGRLFLVGGVESHSQAKISWPSPSAAAAETLAREQGISREAQDEWARQACERAAAAREILAADLAPVYHGDTVLEADEIGTAPTWSELPPLLDRFGALTAGNTAPAADGAVALLVGDEQAGAELGLQPLGFLHDYAYAGGDEMLTLLALEALEARGPYSVGDAELIEMDEGSAAQVLVLKKLLREHDRAVSPDRLNVNGGALALGQATGATGARLVLGALRELRQRQMKTALLALDGAALWLESAP